MAEGMMVVKEPETPEEWQNAMDGAIGARALHSARLYGLVTGGPEVNIDRCEEILRMGHDRGFSPRPDAIERFMSGLLAEEARMRREIR